MGFDGDIDTLPRLRSEIKCTLILALDVDG